MSTGYLTHPACLTHEMPNDHPDSPARLSAINDALIEARLMNYLEAYEAPEVTEEQLERAHSREYIAWVGAHVPDTGYFEVDADTQMNAHTFEAARHAAGAVVRAVDLVVTGELANAFCAVRPPGHHATRDRAMGFCFFNNIAIGACHALAAHGLERIAVIDFDAHQGNGTLDIIGRNPRVLFCSSYQHPFYPFSESVDGDDRVLDLPLPAGSRSSDFRSAVADSWLPRIDAFEPELILVSAGFDAHVRDHMASFALTEDDFAWLTQEIVDLAQSHAGGRVVSALEGGYDLAALGASVTAHVRVLLGL